MTKKKDWRLIVSEMLALLACGLPFGYLVYILETKALGFTELQWFWSHLVHGLYYFAGHLCANKKYQLVQRFGEMRASMVALCMYGLPCYVLGTLIVGASLKQIFWGLVIQTVASIIVAKPYGFLLDWLSRFFCLKFPRPQVE